jgi:4-hydroxy-tetrahydrodipicolinate reductase
MGHAAAEAVVRAGLHLVPFTLTGYSAGVAVSNGEQRPIGVSGIPVELVGKERRQEAMDRIKERHPGLIVVDYTMPNCVNGARRRRARAREGRRRAAGPLRARAPACAGRLF